MTPSAAVPRGAAPAALLFGLAAAFVAGIGLARLARPELLADPEPAWALPRLAYGLGVAAGAAAAGVLAAAVFAVLLRSGFLPARLAAVPLSRAGLAALAVAAVAAGTVLRLGFLEWSTPALFFDFLTCVEPTLALRGRWSDFGDAIREVPFGVPRPFGVVGVVYLEAFRLSLTHLGTTIVGFQLLSGLAGALSLLTAWALGRRLLPAGGGTLTVLALAGMRWHLIVSQWGWHAVAVAPLCDLAALLLVSARPRDGASAAAFAGAAGAAAGLAAHVYLSAWAAAAGLAAFALWPPPDGVRSGGSRAAALRRAGARGGVFLAGLALAAAPLFVLRDGRRVAYFERTSHNNLALEIRRTGSFMPPFSAAADALVSPWLIGDPVGRNDLPGRSRLGWILGIPVAVALLRCLARPGDEVSGYLLTQAGAAFAAALAGGQAHLPNGFRFAYLTTPAAVAAACGTAALLARAAPARRRSAAYLAVGLFAVSGTLGAFDALARWPFHRATFDSFGAQDFLVGRAALRWEGYGAVTVSDAVGAQPGAIGLYRRYRLAPSRDLSRRAPAPPPLRASRAVRIAPPGAPARPEERAVERVRDAWGREWAVVLASPPPTP